MDSARTPNVDWMRIRRSLVSGILALVPIVVTVVVVTWTFNVSAGVLAPVLDPLVGHWPFLLRASLSLILLVAGLVLLGEVATHVVGRQFITYGERIVLKLPIVKVVYRAAKQVVEAFQGPERESFKSVVLVAFPGPGMRAVGFLTGRIRGEDGSAYMTVFVPTTPNPTTGFMQLVPEHQVTLTDFTVEEGVKMIMSLGALVPDRVATLL